MSGNYLCIGLTVVRYIFQLCPSPAAVQQIDKKTDINAGKHPRKPIGRKK
jgi:hypothetical protein